MPREIRKIMPIHRLFIDSEVKTEPCTVPMPFEGSQGRGSSTRFVFSASPKALFVRIEADCAVPPTAKKRPPKGRVFEDDCLEIFLRPQIDPANPFPASLYYGWEVNPEGVLLEYRAGIGSEGVRLIGSGSGRSALDGSGARPGVEPVFGILRDRICGTEITFDYDWHSRAAVTSRVSGGGELRDGGAPEPLLWTVELIIPWEDFGLDQAPRGEQWFFTVNRIEQDPGEKPGLSTLLEGTETPAFHQPASFIPLQFD